MVNYRVVRIVSAHRHYGDINEVTVVIPRVELFDVKATMVFPQLESPLALRICRLAKLTFARQGLALVSFLLSFLE